MRLFENVIVLNTRVNDSIVISMGSRPSIITSVPETDNVNTNVPSGSPSFSARLSASLTTANSQARVMSNSRANMNVKRAGCERSASRLRPKRRNPVRWPH